MEYKYNTYTAFYFIYLTLCSLFIIISIFIICLLLQPSAVRAYRPVPASQPRPSHVLSAISQLMAPQWRSYARECQDAYELPELC